MKQKFSTTLAVTSTYAGEHAAGYISAALLSADTLDRNLITLHPNVKFKEVISRLDASNLIADATCDFTDAGAIALTEVILEPKQLQVNLKLCKSEFIGTWESMSLGYSAFNNIPASFNDYLISYVGGKIAEATEGSIWLGDGTKNGQFSGLIELAEDSADTVSITGATITSLNVMDKLEEVYGAIPAAIFGKEDLRIFVSQKVAKAYVAALSADGFMNYSTAWDKPLNYQGITMELVNGLVGDVIFAAQISNLHFGTGLMSDFNEVKVIDMSDIDGSDNYRIVFRFTAAVQIGIPEEVVLYKGV